MNDVIPPEYHGRIFFICVLTLFLNREASAQISISSNGFTYSQNFNALSSVSGSHTWANNSTLTGWYAANVVNGLVGSYQTDDGSATSGPTLYSYGASGSTDRALGSLNRNADGDVVYGVLFQNNSGGQINSITLAFTVEQWRRVSTSVKGYQRVKVSYSIANSISLTSSGLFDDNSFIELPESFLISLDTTTLAASQKLNGNAVGNLADVSVSFPVTIASGQQLFIRFYDEDIASADLAMAVDNFQATFSFAVAPRIIASSDYSFFPYIDQGTLIDIPAAGAGFNYIIPTVADDAAWTNILQNFYAASPNSTTWNSVASAAQAYDYQLAEFSDQINSRTYFVLRKRNHSPYFWGTYVKAIAPQNTVLVVQAPHPIQDSHSDRQAAAVFQITGAYAYMVAGISRCASDIYSPCPTGGKTAICGTSEPYRMSDVPHTNTSIFHVATGVLAGVDLSLIFLQLHGFAQSPGEPNFYISCGTQNAHMKSVPDFPVLLRESIINSNPAWNVTITHVDNNSTLGAQDNVQGRLLNLYPNDICVDPTKPATVTNRFLHIEQYNVVRTQISYYDDIAAIINNVVNPSPYNRSILINNITDTYTQSFNSLSSMGGTHTWGNNIHLPGWYAVQDIVGLFSRYRINNGSDTTSGIYSYGSIGSADRALGSLNADTTSGNIAYGVLLKNNTGIHVDKINLSYRVEQWHRETSLAPLQRVKLSYTINNSVDLTAIGLLNNALFTNVPGGDMLTLDDNLGAGAMDGNLSSAVINITIPVSLNDGQEIFIRFLDEKTAGPQWWSNEDKAVAIDDFSVSFSTNSLPIRWISFDVNDHQGFAQLLWVTADELMCDRYEVLRSTNGFDFEPVKTNDCNGSPTNKYEFVDSLTNGPPIVYYKVAQYDLNGDVSYSNVQAFRRNKFFQPEIIYHDEFLEVVTSAPDRLHAVIFLDMLGREIRTEIPTSQYVHQYRVSYPYFDSQVMIIKSVFDSGLQIKKIVISR